MACDCRSQNVHCDSASGSVPVSVPCVQFSSTVNTTRRSQGAEVIEKGHEGSVSSCAFSTDGVPRLYATRAHKTFGVRLL